MIGGRRPLKVLTILLDDGLDDMMDVVVDILRDSSSFVDDGALLGAVVDGVAMLTNLTFEKSIVLDLVHVLLLDLRHIVHLDTKWVMSNSPMRQEPQKDLRSPDEPQATCRTPG